MGFARRRGTEPILGCPKSKLQGHAGRLAAQPFRREFPVGFVR